MKHSMLLGKVVLSSSNYYCGTAGHPSSAIGGQPTSASNATRSKSKCSVALSVCRALQGCVPPLATPSQSAYRFPILKIALSMDDSRNKCRYGHPAPTFLYSILELRIYLDRSIDFTQLRMDCTLSESRPLPPFGRQCPTIWLKLENQPTSAYLIISFIERRFRLDHPVGATSSLELKSLLLVSELTPEPRASTTR